MDGAKLKKSISLEKLANENTNNINELKEKLHEIILAGEKYQFDITDCLKSLLRHSDQGIVLLSVQGIAELVKCEEKRQIYSQEDIVKPILEIITTNMVPEKQQLLVQCCRALGNLCCDCDSSRKLLLNCDGLEVLCDLLEISLEQSMFEIVHLLTRALLNYAIGGEDFTEPITKSNLIKGLRKVLERELNQENSNDDVISTVMTIYRVISENTTEMLYDEPVNKLVLSILRNTTDMQISVLCLEHLNLQAENDFVKLLVAKEGGVQLLCSRLELFTGGHYANKVAPEDEEMEAIMRQACDLIVIVLTGDEAMCTLYNNGVGEVYLTMIKWLDSPNHQLLATAVLAIGNFARRDEHCAHMMDDNIYDKLLDIFEVYNGFAVSINKEPDITHTIYMSTVLRIEHGALSALRNLTVPVENKRKVAAKGRAAPLLIRALPSIEEHFVAYKMLAAIRMLVDGQESVAKQLASNPLALASVARWALSGESAGAAGEAPRLLAWTVKLLTRDIHWRYILEVEGCISSLVYMLVASHYVMQNEAILALTLLGIESLKKLSPESNQSVDYEKSYINQLVNAEIGKHIAVLVETNCTKMPVEVAENLIAFLDITTSRNKLALDYKGAKVQDTLKKFNDSRNDFSDDLKASISVVIAAISDIDNHN